MRELYEQVRQVESILTKALFVEKQTKNLTWHTKLAPR